MGVDGLEDKSILLRTSEMPDGDRLTDIMAPGLEDILAFTSAATVPR
jgi:hypothetical protein